MRALSALPVDDDIVDRIMIFCPTFGTLQAIILVSKAFYSVYQTHPKSITRAVAYNMVGPALPQALRVIRYPYATPEDGNRREDEPAALATDCPEEHSPSVITTDEKARLQDNAKIIGALEDIYSLTQKDRTSRVSVLTSEESWRFRRAAYRIMHYCTLFSVDHHDDDFDGDGISDDVVKHVHRQRTAVLNEYSTHELLQLYAVMRFFRSILEDVTAGEDDQSTRVDILLTSGPEGAKFAWEDRSYDSLDDDVSVQLDNDLEWPLYVGYFSVPLDNIWTARKVKPPKDEEPATKWILDEIRGANDTCSQCAAPGGLTLLTEANWHRMQPFYPLGFLKGRLQHTPTIRTTILDAVNRCYVNEGFGPWIASVFDFAAAERTRVSGASTSTVTTSEWDGWDRDKSYCQPCLTKFLVEHTWRWLKDDMVKGGWMPPEDCWYGYNCRTMVHNHAHATKKNHLCVPTRGDL
ncbi:hypothetical protein K438DRAFT_1859751 [Mycena galopus ATCC 62051]|nr:hypothetical protein K438DRAFT_1859751 [Mycena galopus ATCC 62051]